MRRRCRRRINHKFDKTYFKPRGMQLHTLEEVQISFEELEVLRLRYIKKLNQINAAKKMNISQSQYQRDLTAALRKITEALVEGHAISIENSRPE